MELSEFAKNCRASTYSPRVRAQSGNGKWKEYENADKVPLGNPDWSETALLEKKPHQLILGNIQGSGQDFAEYTSYCFDPDGNLPALERELRMAWGWGFSDKRRGDKTGRETIKSHFFNIRTGQETPHLQGDTNQAATRKVSSLRAKGKTA